MNTDRNLVFHSPAPEEAEPNIPEEAEPNIPAPGKSDKTEDVFCLWNLKNAKL